MCFWLLWQQHSKISAVCRAIYHAIGIAPDPDVDDLYTQARNFPLAYNVDDDPEVCEFSKDLEHISEKSLDEPDSDLSDSEDEPDESEPEGDTEGLASSATTHAVASKPLMIRIPPLKKPVTGPIAKAVAVRKARKVKGPLSPVAKVRGMKIVSMLRYSNLTVGP